MLFEVITTLGKSFVDALKEWKYLLMFILIGSLNLYVLFLSTLNYLGLLTKNTLLFSIISILIQFSLLASYHMVIGRFARRAYNMEKLSLQDTIIRGIYSAFVAIIFMVLWFILIRTMSTIFTTNIWGILTYLILNIVFMLLFTSVVLENIRAFYLEKEIFSLYSVLSRMVNPRYLAGFIFTIIVSVILYYSYGIIEKISAWIIGPESPYLYGAINSFLIGGVLFGYLTFTILIFFIRIMNLND